MLWDFNQIRYNISADISIMKWNLNLFAYYLFSSQQNFVSEV